MACFFDWGGGERGAGDVEFEQRNLKSLSCHRTSLNKFGSKKDTPVPCEDIGYVPSMYCIPPVSCEAAR